MAGLSVLLSESQPHTQGTGVEGDVASLMPPKSAISKGKMQFTFIFSPQSD